MTKAESVSELTSPDIKALNEHYVAEERRHLEQVLRMEAAGNVYRPMSEKEMDDKIVECAVAMLEGRATELFQTAATQPKGLAAEIMPAPAERQMDLTDTHIAYKACRLILQRLARTSAEIGAIEVMTRAEHLRPRWEKLAGRWMRAAAAFKVVDAEAAAFVEAAGDAGHALEMSRWIGNVEIISYGGGLVEVLAEGVAAGFVTDSEIRGAK